MDDTTAHAIQTAREFEDVGEDGKAAKIYGDILMQQPDNMEAKLALGALRSKLQSSIEQMRTLIRAGLYTEAIYCANSAISAHPSSPELLTLLGTALMGLDKFDEAREIFEVAYSLTPTDTQVITNLGACSIKLGDSKSAINYFGRLILLAPADADGHYKLGLALETDGKSEAAIGSFAKAIECNPRHVGALTRMSSLCRTMGYNDHAIDAQSRAVDLSPDDTELWLRLGELYLVTEKHKEAIRVLSHTLELDEKMHKARCALGFALHGDEQSEKAIKQFQTCLDAQPDDLEAVKGMALTSKKTGDLITAREMFAKWSEADANNPVALTNAGEFHYENLDLATARSFAERALELAPRSKPSTMLLGMIEKSAGNFEGFEAHLRRTLELDPKHASALRFLIDFAEVSELDDFEQRLEEIASDPTAKLTNRTDALYGLSAIAKKRGNDAEMVAALDRVSTLVLDDHENTFLDRRRRETDAIRALFDTPPAPLAITRPRRPTPIFILGMPRSGTTMTEQILSNHSMVFGGGELPFARLATRRSNEKLETLTPEQLSAFREIYMSQLNGLAHDGAPFVTDKMPMNFTYLGFIAQAIPEARIINLNRQPEAVCWSNFRSPFGAKGLEYSFHQRDIGLFYREYQDIMRFWRERFPDRIYDLHYEAVTEDPESHIRPLVTWLDLPWEDGLIEIRRNKRAIRTASYKQVRQDIYKGSSEEWRRYEPYIQPMLQALRGEE